ncbi:MAG: L,D-transpeptidase family protein [bacterium]|jgi:hypothetical protein
MKQLLAVLLTTAIYVLVTAATALFNPAEAIANSVTADGTEIVVDTDKRRLIYYEAGLTQGAYPIAIGKSNTPSPLGEWKITGKISGLGGAFGTRWLGLNVPWGTYGIHGTNMPWSIGRQASAGCIRMNNRDVEQLFAMVEVGTPVRIVGEKKFTNFRPVFRQGSTGQDVVYLQMRLRESGFPAGPADGRFGAETERIVRELQIFYGFRDDGIVNQNMLRLLNLK